MNREAPWDRLDGYNLPIVNMVRLGGAATLLARADSMRTLLVIGLGDTNGNPLTISMVAAPSPLIDTNSNGTPGMFITVNSGPLIIDWRKWGPGVTAEWYGASINALDFSIFAFVMQITAREWPGSRDFKSLIQQANDGYFRQ